MEWYIYIPAILAVAVALTVNYLKFKRSRRGYRNRREYHRK
jgi:hypothetical protein